MHVKFCGAARQVTGSCHLITLDSGYKILLDCGLYQGYDDELEDFNEKFLFDPADVDCVILSHAHIDHSGRLPKLVKDGFEGPIYASHATRSLCAVMLMDSAKIQKYDAEYASKKAGQEIKPLYNSKDVKRCMEMFVTFGYDRWYNIHPDVDMMYRDAGHILGSATVSLKARDADGEEKRLGFTGDIGRPDRPILRDPAPMPEVDYLITESTYGDEVHKSKPEEKEKLLSIIKHTCLEKKGKLIIPAFSVGRTQEIVFMMDKMANEGLLPKIPVYVDSPLAVNATQVFVSHPECYDGDLQEYMLTDKNPFGFNDLEYIRKVEASKALNSMKEPCVIISAAGMMQAGRVKHHLYNNIRNKKNTVLIVGYCAPYTPGGLLKSGVSHLKIFGEKLPVHIEVQIMDSFSSHGDQKEMAEFLANQKERANEIFLVHGEYDTQMSFATYLKERGFNSPKIPTLGESFRLN